MFWAELHWGGILNIIYMHMDIMQKQIIRVSRGTHQLAAQYGNDSPRLIISDCSLPTDNTSSKCYLRGKLFMSGIMHTRM